MKDPHPPKVVTQRTLDLYDKYDQDFGLLDEHWADKKDRNSITAVEAKILGQYIDHLHQIKVESLSAELRDRYMNEIENLELHIQEQVVQNLKARINNP